MTTTSLSDLKAHLSEYTDKVEHEHERYTITRNGRPAAVLVSADEWESLQETIFWLSQRHLADDLVEAEQDVAAGRVYDEDEVRQALNLPPRR
jgi:antitoxin YefM